MPKYLGKVDVHFLLKYRNKNIISQENHNDIKEELVISGNVAEYHSVRANSKVTNSFLKINSITDILN